jgi:hypothetical protein
VEEPQEKKEPVGFERVLNEIASYLIDPQTKKFKKTFKFSCLRAFSHYLCLGFS